jgi:predicted permease
MGKSFVLIPLFALLLLAAWFAGSAWVHLGGGDPIPFYGYVAIAGGVLFSLLIGGGLMALVFYSSRYGYDDLSRDDDA